MTGAVQVPVLLQATASVVGSDLVARIPQQGVAPYRILRMQIQGPQVDVGSGYLFRMYLGTIATYTQFSQTNSTQSNSGQFSPGEYIPQGNDVIGVWEGAGSSGVTATLTLTTDGGV